MTSLARIRILSTATLIAALACARATAFAKPAPEAKIALPKDPMAVVITYDPGAGGFIRKGPPPYLKIQADGNVTVTNLFDGKVKQRKLTPAQLDELLRFIIQEQDFFNVTQAKITAGIQAEMAKGVGIAIGGAGTAKIEVHAEGKQHEVSYRGAAAYLQTYPNIAVLKNFVAVEKRLSSFGRSVEQGK